MLLGYMRTSESAVALARVEFRSLSGLLLHRHLAQRDNMKLDLGIRYDTLPPWLDEGGHWSNLLPFQTRHAGGRPVPPGVGESAMATSTRIADPVPPNIHNARDGRMGDRMVTTTE